MSKLDRHTVLIDDEAAAVLRPFRSLQSTEKQGPHTKRCDEELNHRRHPMDASRIPVRGLDTTNIKPILVPVLAGSPWKHYTREYFVKHWCLFAIAISKQSRDKLYVIRSSPTLNDEKLQIIRQISHPNVLESIEIYSEEDNNYYIVSGMIETSLMHVCRAPEYPSEAQLSSILFQVRRYFLDIRSEYLITQGLVPETITCGGVLINLAGEVKISNFEEFQTGERGPKAQIGLSHPDRWSSEAVHMLSLLDSEPSMEELAMHKFWKRGRKEELKSLVYFTLITAYHSRS
ncbi:hypothetical protein IWW34DRAFT_639334 [Fusarium oxysporum f. sp. albedinis]|nr:hypothetical protein IWW34DRAFT_639334 [Fusarium oxysporum f. sp. albedinis]